MNLHRRRIQPHQGFAFGCRYVQRTLGQLGEEALSLPLVSRHLSECPACRAHRRRISRVDTAFQEILHRETPPFFEGRWESIRNSLPIGEDDKADKNSGRFSRLNIRLIAAVIGLATLAGTAWSVDHRTPAAGDTPIAIGPGVSVTSASLEGEKVNVAVEAEDDEDGTLYMWLGPEIEDYDQREDRQ